MTTTYPDPDRDRELIMRIPADALVKLGCAAIPRDCIDWQQIHPRFMSGMTFATWTDTRG